VRYYMIDRITQLSPPERAQAVKCVSLSDDVFLDHFPGYPIMPGSLILEGLAQLGGVLVEATMRLQGREDLHAVLTMADRVRFRRVVRPGDKLLMEALTQSVTEDGGRVTTSARCDADLCAEATLTYAFARITNPRLIQLRKDALRVWTHGAIEDLES
jgi:3-hydroxyacyl-[acyl-carrier-protein] dehydratase